MITLYTVQDAGIDLTIPWEPGFDYADPEGSHYAMAQHLGWPWWIWCFPTLADFDCPPAMNSDYWLKAHHGELWTLQVPADRVKWCGVQGLCFGPAGFDHCFYPTADACRETGDTPQGLVCGRIDKRWVVGRKPAIHAFERAGVGLVKAA